MSKEDIADLVRRVLISVAPEVENQSLDPDADFRDQVDLDSMDSLTSSSPCTRRSESTSRRRTTRSWPA